MLHHGQLIVVANALPPQAPHGSTPPAPTRTSGVVHAVEPFLAATSGVWIGEHGDAIHPTDASPATASAPYRVRRLSLSPEEEVGFYDGVVHGGLWPLCHRAGVAPMFDGASFETYRTINARFARAVCEEAADDQSVIFVQNYHFALVPRLVRERLPQARIATFWHVPWPAVERLEQCPWHAEILEGLLASDVLGFQTPLDCRDFLESAEALLDVVVDRGEGTVSHGGREVLVRDYPASIARPGMWTSVGPTAQCRAWVRRGLNLPPDVRIGVGVDRLDYTKGIPEKLLGMERLLERQPELCGRFVFVQLLQPSRMRLPISHNERRRILAAAERVNARFGRVDYRPILIFEGHHAPATVARYFRAADFCFVGSLHDGMNLEAKEFVASRDDEQGVLVLSAYAGATCELADAVIADPTDQEDVAAALDTALAMTPDEQRTRMAGLRETLDAHDAIGWGRRILDDTMKHRPDDVAGQAAMPTGD